MAAPSVTYTFVNSTTASATEVNTNFTDLINGASDGTKDYTINAFTANSTATLLGNMQFGNALSDDIDTQGSFKNNIAVKTTNTYDIGSSTIGWRVLYLGANSQTVGILGSSSMSATWTLTLPITAGTDSYLLATNGSGVSSWQQRNDCSGLENIGFTTSVGSSALTVGLVSADGAAFSATNIGWVNFKHTTTTTGQKLIGKITAAPTALVISSGSTLGFVSGTTNYAYIYLFYVSSSSFVIGISGTLYDEGSFQSSTADDAAGGSDSIATIYTPNGVAAVSSKPVRLVGRVKFSLTTAGTWDEVGDELSLPPFMDNFYLEANCTANTASGNADTATDVTGMTLTLAPGEWLIGYNLNVSVVNGGSAASATNYGGVTRIHESGGTELTGTATMIRGVSETTTGILNAVHVLSTVKRIRIDATTTYKVVVIGGQAAATAVVTVYTTGGGINMVTGDDTSSKLWAQRLN